jgi:hypothetical protein
MGIVIAVLDSGGPKWLAAAITGVHPSQHSAGQGGSFKGGFQISVAFHGLLAQPLRVRELFCLRIPRYRSRSESNHNPVGTFLFA